MIRKDFIDDRRAYIYAIKTFAIFSVICAHVAGVNAQYSYSNMICGNILKSLGAIGVSIFFILSGYLFSNTRTNFGIFFKKKMVTILIPWFFTGSLVYLYVAIRKTSIDIHQWCNWVLGNSSYLYYLAMLIVSYMFFWFSKSRLSQVVLMSLSVFSIMITGLGFLPNMNPFMNPFNWFLYFGFGCCLQSNNWFDQLSFLSKKIFVVWISAFILLIGYVTYENAYLSYWKLYYLFAEFVAVMLIFGICTYKKVYENKIVVYIGQVSFSIYLLHMPIAGLITNIFGRIDSSVLTIARPFVVLIITVLFISIYTKIASMAKYKKILNLLIGIR